MTCYRSREEFDARFDWNPTGPMHFKTATFEVESYMDYQANKFARLFDPNCYLLLSKAMDLTNLGRPADSDPGAAQPGQHPAVLRPQLAARGGGLQVRPRRHVQRADAARRVLAAGARVHRRAARQHPPARAAPLQQPLSVVDGRWRCPS
ncbi:hypothetical protein ON010_g19012 [Phytophthora cinnamomi]|nr:hypothetical protein ON010_g19012 [Phytophthora cinnamomi]